MDMSPVNLGVPNPNPNASDKMIGQTSVDEDADEPSAAAVGDCRVCAFDSDLEAYAAGYFDVDWEILPTVSVQTPSLPSDSARPM